MTTSEKCDDAMMSPTCTDKMQIEVVSDYDDLIALQDIWNNVLSQSRNDVAYLRHEWFLCWWRSFREDRKLFVLLIKEAGETIGIAPFCLKKTIYRNLVAIDEMGFCANSISPRVDFIVVKNKEQTVIQLVMDYLLDRRQLWDILRLNKICTESPTCGILKTVLSKMKLPSRTTEGVRSPRVCTDGEWQTYFAGRSRKFKSCMRNKLNRVGRFGDVEIVRIEEGEDLNRCLSIIFDVSSKSWKHGVGRSIAQKPDQATFYTYITESLGKKGWIRIWLLKYQDGCMAFEYQLVYNGVACPIRADFDEEYHYISPGSFLEYNIINRMFDDPGIREYDFCGDYYKYMLNWTPLVREHVNVAVFNNRLVSRSVGWTERRLAPALSRGIGLFVNENTQARLCRRR
ncbi:MAG: GNAT family N-acetyltransferase [Planctomycetota bacterium]|jgi:CelD/BcsL family acetyltransferase involved in cellulose biosynthesis